MKIAVQLYTLRHDYEGGEEFLKILEQVKAAGFDGVEFAGFNGLSYETIKAKLDELGLEAVGCHMSTDDFDGEENIQKAIAMAKALGMNSVGTGGAPHSDKEDMERLSRIYSAANKAGEKEGIRFYYHNHCTEFNKFIDGEEIIDIIKKDAFLQVDTYWSFHAGVDNYDFITKNKDRIAHLHIKDGIDGKPKAIGEGNCDVASVFKAAKEIGLDWVILENDDPVPNGMEDIKRSMKYMKTMI